MPKDAQSFCSAHFGEISFSHALVARFGQRPPKLESSFTRNQFTLNNAEHLVQPREIYYLHGLRWYPVITNAVCNILSVRIVQNDSFW